MKTLDEAVKICMNEDVQQSTQWLIDINNLIDDINNSANFATFFRIAKEHKNEEAIKRGYHELSGIFRFAFIYGVRVGQIMERFDFEKLVAQ